MGRLFQLLAVTMLQRTSGSHIRLILSESISDIFGIRLARIRVIVTGKFFENRY